MVRRQDCRLRLVIGILGIPRNDPGDPCCGGRLPLQIMDRVLAAWSSEVDDEYVEGIKYDRLIGGVCQWLLLNPSH